jgi:hypothetical protein
MSGRKKHWYGFEWAYGIATDGTTGAPIGRLHVFATRQARDTWTQEAAGVPRSAPGYRQGVPCAWQRYDAEPVEHGREGEPCA